ncbi:hypothetical protein QE152_g13374 [Popillia japonica]|uniref:Transposable element P transposase-like RNase H domain-containing protein n=1 Tax=Popillia japonica TaxID=7064 RepID=A0AAW1LCB3_POPJA
MGETDVPQEWKKWNPHQLKENKHNLLQPPRKLKQKDELNNKLEEMIEKRENMLTMQTKTRKRENDLKEKQMKVEQEFNMKKCELKLRVLELQIVKEQLAIQFLEKQLSITLQAGLSYSKYRDVIERFECFGSTSHVKIADHALVFLAHGTYSNWKQPLAFMFCEAATNKTHLAVRIIEVVRAVLSTGLMPIGTVCDQASQNQAAIKYLIEETRDSHIP